MATATPGQQDDQYQNWLRCSVSLLYLKEGIEGFTDKRVSDLHEELHTAIPQPYSRHGPAIQQQSSSSMQDCTSCSYNDIHRHKNTWKIRCPSKVCSIWLQYIIGYHVDGGTCNIARANLKPQLWPSDPWEVAKWFLPVGSENIKSARGSDVAAILKLLKNCQFMANFITNSTIVEEVLAIRHRLMHSGDMKVSDDQLREDTDKMVKLMNSLIQLTPTEIQSVQRAIDNITKVQSKTMDLTRTKEVTALHSRMQSVNNELARLRLKCTDYDKTSQDLSRTEQELRSLNDDHQHMKTEIKQLEISKERFEQFLQENDLVQDLARLSDVLQHHDERLDHQEHATDSLGQRIDEQGQLLDKHKQRLDQQEHSTDSLGQRMDEQGQRLDKHKQRFDHQEHATDSLGQRMDEQGQVLDKHKQRLDYQEHATDSLGQRMDEQGQILDTHKQRLDQQEHSTDSLGQRIDEQGQLLDKHKQRLDQQEHSTDSLGQRIDEQGQLLDKHKQRLDQQEHSTDSLGQRMDEQGQVLDKHKQRLDHQEHATDSLGQRMDEQGQVLDKHKQRIEQQEHTTDSLGQQMAEQSQSLHQQNQRIEQQGQQIDEQNQKILTFSEQVMSKPDAPVAGSSRSWDDQCKDLQKVLMSHYRHTCLVIENPLDTNDVGLEYMYVAPSIKVLRESLGRDGLENVEEEATNMSCKQVFFTKDYQCRNIYITGGAGTGKSMLCRNIVRLWCEAHGGLNIVENEESDSDSDEDDGNMLERRQAGKTRHEQSKDRSEEDRLILSQFKLLFYITLRDSLYGYKITDMIQSQILQHHDTIEGLKVSALLKNECCLVICDGLDEWVCPEGSTIPHFVNSGIPGRDITIENSVFLTTTRPWKFDVLQLKSSEVDKHVELIGISEQSASQLCSKVIKILRKSKSFCKKKRDFFITLKQRDLDHFKMIPVILVQLICLWFEYQDLPKSQVQLYCDILEHLLTKAEKNISQETIITSKDVKTKRPMPECFKDHPSCHSHQQLIYCLSKLAFEALFDKTRENSLVFRSSQMELFGLGQETIDICLKSGILSQSKVLDKVSVSEKKISFIHKKVQEFLASLFIAGYVDSPVSDQQMAKKANKIPINHMTDFCNTIGTCLEMSQVYMFMSGLRPDLTQQLLTHFTHVVTTDKHKQLQKYRQSYLRTHLIRDIQACITDCVVEGSYHGYKYGNLCLADFYITKSTLCDVKPLFVCTKRSKVKSVLMRTEGTDKDQLRAITSQLQHCHSVQKLYLDDPKPCYIHVDTVTVIVNNNINTLTSLFLDSDITATDELVTALCSFSSSKCLMALYLSCYMTHKHIEQIIARVSQLPTIRQLLLALVCTDHDNQCRPRIDVSTMTHIQGLGLYFMSVDNLQSVSHCVKWVRLEDVTLPVTALHEFTRSISQTTRYVKVKLEDVTVTEVTDGQVDMKTFLRTCPGLKVTKCQYNDSNKTWSIDFTTNRQ